MLRKSRPLIFITCHSTAATTELMEKQPLSAYTKSQRRFILQRNVRDECRHLGLGIRRF
jgi:hypothetical protein